MCTLQPAHRHALPPADSYVEDRTAATVSGVAVYSIAENGAASPEVMADELSWQWGAFPLPQLQPIPQDRCVTLAGDGPDPMSLPAGHTVFCAGLQQSHDAASRRARCAGEWPEHARGGDEHGVWAASDGGA
jgi:hypothetical protein